MIRRESPGKGNTSMPMALGEPAAATAAKDWRGKSEYSDKSPSQGLYDSLLGLQPPAPQIQEQVMDPGGSLH
ncbi:hypothetical protein BTVI_139628 [Pitangus sulphuratus]|nr:hypothetical protein BTVI_139628 [Pitangus sulphuratus]